MTSVEWSCLVISIALALLFVVWRRPRQLSTHDWRVRSAERALRTIRQIGAESGPTRQFSYLRKVDPFVFEELVMSALQSSGYRVKRSTRYTGDGGIDGECWIENARHLVQIKRYRQHIQAKHVADFTDLCLSRNVKGLFVHSGRTGEKSWAHGRRDIDIISGQRLLALLGTDPPRK